MKAGRRSWLCGALLVGGGEEMVARLPAGLPVEPYSNAGYRLTLEPDGSARVAARAGAVASSAVRAAGSPSQTEIGRLAWAIAGDAVGVYDTVGRTLAWVARSLRYELDRQAPQDALSVLRRRSAYCTGYARAAVALLRSLGVEAREVPGWDAESSGFHRWIEVRYPDVGWVFSDPRRHHHFVPATFVRLRGEAAPAGLALTRNPAEPLRRTGGFWTLAEIPALGADVRVAPNTAPQRSALSVAITPGNAATVSLLGDGLVRRQTPRDGTVRFADLAPGAYELRLQHGSTVVARRMLEIEPEAERRVALSPAAERSAPR